MATAYAELQGKQVLVQARTRLASVLPTLVRARGVDGVPSAQRAQIKTNRGDNRGINRFDSDGRSCGNGYSWVSGTVKAVDAVGITISPVTKYQARAQPQRSQDPCARHTATARAGSETRSSRLGSCRAAAETCPESRALSHD